MSLKKLISEAGLKQILEKGDQFMRYWKTVSEDLQTLTTAMIKNFEITNKEIQSLKEKMENLKNETDRQDKTKD